MKRLIPLVLVAWVMLVGCKAEPLKATYLLGKTEFAASAWIEDGTLSVLLLDRSVIESYAVYTDLEQSVAFQHLVGLEAAFSNEVGEKQIEDLSRLLSSLAVATGKASEGRIDDRMRIQTLAESAGHLRKTLLADTLIAIAGTEEVFEQLERVEHAAVYDLRSKLAVSEKSDWQRLRMYLNQYVENIRRAETRSMKE